MKTNLIVSVHSPTPKKLIPLTILILAVALSPDLQAASGAYFGQTPPRATPVVFAPAIGKVPIHPTFSPDGKECFFAANIGSVWTPRLYYSAQASNGVWSLPMLTTFLSNQNTFEPVFSRDGNTLFCSSATIGQCDIYAVVRTAQGWGNPTPLPAPINRTSTEASISQTVDGTFYFASDRPGGFGNNDIYRARFADQSWQAENLGSAINTSGIDVDPFVAPDERFVIVTKIINGTANMCVYFNNRKGGWTAPVSLVSLCSYGYGPDISTDGRYFFFMSSDGTHCRWVSIAAIDNLNPLPTIKTNPASQTALPGDNITFYVAAGGTAPLRYQWSFNQTNFLAITNSTLLLTNVQLTNAGSYSVVVNNTLGAITSSPALLMADPTFVKLGTESPGALSFRSWIGVPFDLECSGDLIEWFPFTTLTNLTGTLEFADGEAPNYPCRFYRAAISPNH